MSSQTENNEVDIDFEALYKQEMQKLEQLREKANLQRANKNTEMKEKLQDAEKNMEKLVQELKHKQFMVASTNHRLEGLKETFEKENAAYDPVDDQLRVLDDEINLLTARAEESKSPVDLIEVHRTQLAITGLQPRVLEGKILRLQNQITLSDFSTKVADAEKDLDDFKPVMEEAEIAIKKLKQELDLLETPTQLHEESIKVPVVGVQDDIEAENKRLNAELEFTKQTIVNQIAKIEFLEAANEKGDKGAILALDVSEVEERHRGVTPHTDDNAALIQELKEKIEQMTPLFNIGTLVRTRKLVHEIPQVTSDRSILFNSSKAIHSGQAVADATMFMNAAIFSRGPEALFEEAYGVSPTFVWENRSFITFATIINWRADMKKNQAAGKDAFMESFNKIFTKVYPSLEIKSDQELRADPVLTRAYQELAIMHRDAEEISKMSRMGPKRG